MSAEAVALIACSVCFGAADGPMLSAARVGVLVMAGVTLAVLTAFGVFFARLAKNGENGERAHPSRESSLFSPGKGTV
jgi:hypothetical protein